MEHHSHPGPEPLSWQVLHQLIPRGSASVFITSTASTNTLNILARRATSSAKSRSVKGSFSICVFYHEMCLLFLLQKYIKMYLTAILCLEPTRSLWCSRIVTELWKRVSSFLNGKSAHKSPFSATNVLSKSNYLEEMRK